MGAIGAFGAGIIMEVIGMPIFLMFILEEAIQAAGFGVYTLISNKLWERALKQVEYYESLIAHLEKMTKVVRIALDSKAAADALRPEIYVFLMPFYVLGEGLHLDFLVAPFEDFAAATRSSAISYRAAIAAHMRPANPAYYDEKDNLTREIELDNFTVQRAQDARMDELRIAKEKEMDALRAKKKEDVADIRAAMKWGAPVSYASETLAENIRSKKIMQDLRAAEDELKDELRLSLDKELDTLRIMKRAEEVTQAEYDASDRALRDDFNTKERAITEEYNKLENAEYETHKLNLMKIKKKAAEAKEQPEMSKEEGREAIAKIEKEFNSDDILIKKRYAEKEETIRKVYFDNFYVLERIAENKKIALREKHFPTGVIIPPKVYLWEFIETTVSRKAKAKNTQTGEIKYFTEAEYQELVDQELAVPIVWPAPAKYWLIQWLPDGTAEIEEVATGKILYISENDYGYLDSQGLITLKPKAPPPEVPPEEAPPPKEKEEIISVSEDASVNSTSPDRNFGSAKYLRVRSDVEEELFDDIFLKFSIPDKNIKYAFLRLTTHTKYTSRGGAVVLAEVSSEWKETEITWGNMDKGIGDWVYDTTLPSEQNVVVNIEVTELIKKYRGKLVSIRITGLGEKLRVLFFSKENGYGMPNLRLIVEE